MGCWVGGLRGVQRDGIVGEEELWDVIPSRYSAALLV
jgi:hypothetical protein